MQESGGGACRGTIQSPVCGRVRRGERRGVQAPDTVNTLPKGSARALSSQTLHPAPSPLVELGSTQCLTCVVVVCPASWSAFLGRGSLR